MEGRLIAGIHYVELSDKYDNIDEIIDHYSSNPKEAEAIIKNANEYVQQFMNDKLEDLLCLKILQKYTELSGQSNANRFH